MKEGLATILVAVLAAVALAAAAGQVKVKPVVTDDGRVLASFTAADAWTTETREFLQAGQVVTYSYSVELRRPSLWLDPLLARTSVDASAKHDTLTGAYQVSRLRDGRVVRVENKAQESEIRDWLTIFEGIELEPESPLQANTDYYVQVRLSIAPRRNVSLWSVLPFGGSDSSGRQSFTYIR